MYSADNCLKPCVCKLQYDLWQYTCTLSIIIDRGYSLANHMFREIYFFIYIIDKN